MNVSEIMTARPVTIHQDGLLRQALELLEQCQCRHLPVMNNHGQIVGILSDRDIRTALNSPHTLRERWQDEKLIDSVSVRAIMTPAPIVIEPNATVDDATRLMLDHRISCLPVMLGETVVGILTTSDILAAFLELSRRIALIYSKQ